MDSLAANLTCCMFSSQQLKQRSEHVAARFHSYQELLKTIDIKNFFTMERYVYSSTLKKDRFMAVNLKSATKSLKRLVSFAISYSYKQHTSQSINDFKRNGS